jgi:hypothetical protein
MVMALCVRKRKSARRGGCQELLKRLEWSGVTSRGLLQCVMMQVGGWRMEEGEAACVCVEDVSMDKKGQEIG